MPNLLKLLRNNRKKKPLPSNEKALEAIITSTVSADVVQDLTAFSSTSKSSPSNSSSGDSDNSSSDSITPTGGSSRTITRRKQFANAGSQIFRRVKASAHTHLLSRRSSSGDGGGDEASHVSSITTASLHNNIDTPSGLDKLDTPTGRSLLASPLIPSEDESLSSSTCILKENRVPSCQEIAAAISSSREKAALVNAKKEMAARDAKIRYLNCLVKELKSLYTQRLDMKEMELAAVREELETTVKELSAVKQDLVEAIEGHAQLVEDVAKKTREPNCWFSPLQFN